MAAAEHTVALLLAAIGNVPDNHASAPAGEWRSNLYALDQVGTELAGTTAGLVGFGAIGRRVRRILRAFDATVLVHDPYTDPSARTERARSDWTSCSNGPRCSACTPG